MTEETGLTRRDAIRGAAWSIPIVAAAVALPLAAASTDDGDYQWWAPANSRPLTIIPDEGGERGTVTANIVFTGQTPPPGAELHLRLVFQPPVVLVTDPPAPWVRVSPTELGTPTSVVEYVLVPAGQGGSPSFTVSGSGLIDVTASMSLVNGGAATWTDLNIQASAHL